MSSEDKPAGNLRPSGAGPSRSRDLDPEDVRILVDRLRARLTMAIDAWEAEVTGRPERLSPEPPRYSRPAAVPPVRMEQLHRTPQPTADLDDLVDVLAPRLLERLVPALRGTLSEDC